MSTQTYFDTIIIKQLYINRISIATKNVKAAIAWFTDIEIYRAILDTANRGVKIELILMNDEINKDSKVDFSVLEQAGVLLFWFSEDNPGLMHHKFCVIDNHTVLSGSYNWTYRASRVNRENVTVTDDVDVVKEFIKEFLFIREDLKSFSSNQALISIRKLIPYVKYNYIFNNMVSKWGFFDENFTLAIPLEYDEVRPFVEDMAAVRIDEKWGFINRMGKVIVKCIYGEVKDFSDGIAICLKGYYETKCLSHDCKEFDSNANDNEPYDIEVTVGNWGCINNFGEIIIEFKYDSVENFKNGFAIADHRKLIDKQGGEIFKLPYAKSIRNNRFISLSNINDDKLYCYYYIPIDRNQHLKEKIDANEEAYYEYLGSMANAYDGFVSGFLETSVVDLRDTNNNT